MSKKTIRPTLPEPHFTLFEAQREGLQEIVVVNGALLGFKEIAIFPWHLEIVIDVQDVVENGMPAPEEGEILTDLGEKIEAALVDATTAYGGANVIFLARSTWNEIRELYFRVHDPEIAHKALQSLVNGPKMSRPWVYRMEHDPTWEHASPLFRLFPLAEGKTSENAED